MTISYQPGRVSNRVALLVILVSGLFSILWSIGPGSTGTPDFRALYYGARCAIAGENPYNHEVFLARYKLENGAFPSTPKDLQDFLQAIPICVNPPTTLFFAVPFTWLGWAWAHVVWLLIQYASISLCAFLAWRMASEYSSRMPLVVVAILMANCESLFKLGNVSACAIGWSIAAFWSIRNRRFEVAGVIALALSLILKPQVAGVLWLFCLFMDRPFRRRALQSFGIAALICLISVGWISRVSPTWLHDWRANMALTAEPGRINNPAPESNRQSRVNRIISLQTVFAEISDQPRFYNTASAFVCAMLLALWLYYFRSTPLTERTLWFGLACFIPLALLPVYHRQYDAKLLLLTLPACSLMWAKRWPLRKTALVLTIGTFLISADIPYSIIVILSNKLLSSQWSGWFLPLRVLVDNPIPICMLVLGIFYLWLLAKESGTAERVC